MKYGALFPQIALGGDPHAFDAVLRATEALGYDSFAMFDHVARTVHEGSWVSRRFSSISITAQPCGHGSPKQEGIRYAGIV
jgi:hypothetical protein